jgi:hypothetical protein
MCMRDSTNAVGCICYATATSSRSSIPSTLTCEPRAKDVKAVYDRAVAYAGPDPSLPPAKQEAARRKQQHLFEQELWQVCAPYAHTSSPLHTLCERVERFLPELFVFVAVPGVPAENNLAERSVRPLVIARKISGGTRSPASSETRMGLFSLFGTWAAEATQSIPAMPRRPLSKPVFTTHVNNIRIKSTKWASLRSQGKVICALCHNEEDFDISVFPPEDEDYDIEVSAPDGSWLKVDRSYPGVISLVYHCRCCGNETMITPNP